MANRKETVVGPIFEIAKMIFAPICKYCKYYKGANKYRRILRDKWRDLERWKSDKTLEMRAQLLPGKTPKQEVERWIQNVEKLNNEIEAIDSKAGEGKCFSRARIGKLAFKKIQEVDGLYQMGDFTHSLVIDPPLSNGEIMLTPTLIGESTTERVKEEIWACVLDDDVRKIGLYGMGGIEEVLERCAQLPLAIVTIVASFKPLIDDYEWRDALEELRTSVIRTNNREEQVLGMLKYSYERLKDEMLK
nr:putative disease resistance protein [Quercus suber]